METLHIQKGWGFKRSVSGEEPFNFALCHAAHALPHFHLRDIRDRGVRQLITQECLHRQRPVANQFCKLLSENSSNAVALETSGRWLVKRQAVVILNERGGEIPTNSAGCRLDFAFSSTEKALIDFQHLCMWRP